MIPSEKVPGNSREKAEILEQYKQTLSRIPCKHFKHNGKEVVHECPFGSSCFYAHLLPDGVTAAPVPPPRLRVNADGQAEAMGVVKLSTFLDHHAAIS